MKSLIGQFTTFVYRLRHGIRLSSARYARMVNEAGGYADQLRSLSDADLQTRFSTVRDTIRAGAPIEEFTVEATAIAREASERTIGLRPYDVQMLAAYAMLDGQCVEMQTGEGKTLAAALAVCLRALDSRGVHVLTFNDYLSERDTLWMGPLYRFLGLTAGYVATGLPLQSRKVAYACDITYVTAKEAGFDLLRDQLAHTSEARVQRGHHFAIIDEADSILIDEARIPLVIATEAEKDDTDLYEVARTVRRLREDDHYEVKASGRNISLTNDGITLLEDHLCIRELHSAEHAEILARFNLALQAERLLKRDVDYLVRDNAVHLIDEFTGRVAENRKWPGGLQAALEAKEGVAIQPQGEILNTITLQHYLGLYEGLAGMTGTAVEATEELADFYKLQVTIVEPNKPCVRKDHADVIVRTRAEKLERLVQEVAGQNGTGRPVLIGTASVEESDQLAHALRAADVDCRVLNAANDHLEAEIIADAGALGAVTISTNMAGRGTDICLGGHDQQDHAEVVRLGGLYVIGTNRHESRRIDNQLRGRAGRQGDPGESRFFVSLEDDLIARHELGAVVSGVADDSNAFNHQKASERIAHLQRVIEGECYEIRGMLRVYAHLLEVQRRVIAQDRLDLLLATRPPTALRKGDCDLHRQLVSDFGPELIERIERQVTLLHLDREWSRHIARAAEIREGIHLVSYGGFNPRDVYNREMALEFDTFRQHVEERVVATMRTSRITERGIDLELEGLKAPSSTWTFTVNDNPRGAVMSQLVRGVARRLKRMFR